MTARSKSRFSTIIKSLQFLIVLGSLVWAGIIIFGGDPCEKAQAQLQKAKADEQERLQEAKADGYRFTDGASMPVVRAMQRRMYIEQDVAKACSLP